METLVALGLAANILQFVQAGAEFVGYARGMHKTGRIASERLDDLYGISDQLQRTLMEMRQQERQQSGQQDGQQDGQQPQPSIQHSPHVQLTGRCLCVLEELTASLGKLGLCEAKPLGQKDGNHPTNEMRLDEMKDTLEKSGRYQVERVPRLVKAISTTARFNSVAEHSPPGSSVSVRNVANKTDTLEAVSKGFKAMWTIRKIDELQSRLNQLKDQLVLDLLVTIRFAVHSNARNSKSACVACLLQLIRPS